MNTTKTIAAIATATGQGGVAVVRVSGSKAYAIGQALTHRSKLRERYAHFAKIYDNNGQMIDEAVVLYFKAPHSFTGEDVLEIQGHGGNILPNLILARCFELGAVQASAGEFSYRAFDNGKMDLLQAEAISDAISATSIAEARSAVRSMAGQFSEHITLLTEQLTQIRLYVEAMIDFSDEEDVDFLADGVLLAKIDEVIAGLEQTLATAEQGVLLKRGVQVVLAGRPNAGKSSLLNALAGIERAIVTDVAGTTRDTLEETLILRGLSVHLTDTAGLRDSDDKVEQMGIWRAKQAIDAADVVLLVYDVSDNVSFEMLVKELLYDVDVDKVIGVANKMDLLPSLVQDTNAKNDKPDVDQPNIDKPSLDKSDNDKYHKPCYVSCKTKAGLDELIDVICQKVGFYPNDNSIIARTRHLDSLKRTLLLLSEAKEQLIVYQAGELSAESLRLAQNALSQLTGEFSADDLLGRIFSQFCIGK